MTFPAQLDENQANAQLSTGPKQIGSAALAALTKEHPRAMYMVVRHRFWIPTNKGIIVPESTSLKRWRARLCMQSEIPTLSHSSISGQTQK